MPSWASTSSAQRSPARSIHTVPPPWALAPQMFANALATSGKQGPGMGINSLGGPTSCTWKLPGPGQVLQVVAEPLPTHYPIRVLEPVRRHRQPLTTRLSHTHIHRLAYTRNVRRADSPDRRQSGRLRAKATHTHTRLDPPDSFSYNWPTHLLIRIRLGFSHAW